MKRIFTSLLLFSMVILGSVQAHAVTYYVRTDGGTPNGADGHTCNGKADAAWNIGNSPDCAFNHPFWVQPPRGQPTTWKAGPTDTVVIHGPEAGTGVYAMGCKIGSANCLDATINLTNTADCFPNWSNTCVSIVPTNGASNTQRFTFIGCSPTGCGVGTLPQLWLTGRADTLFNIQGSHDINFSNFEVTDHAAQGVYDECAVGNSGLCGRQAFTGGSWYNISMINLYIHGLTQNGMKVGGGGTSIADVNWLMSNVRIEFNPMAGIDTDICGNAGTCGFKGNITFNNVKMNWNGFVEPYPITVPDTPVLGSGRTGETGGYGDAYGGSDTGGTWTINGMECRHNSSDCLDLLYCGRQDHAAYGVCSVNVNGMNCEGNAGNCIKAPPDLVVTNSKLNGNCIWWSQHTNYYQPGSAMCRDGGRAASPIAVSTNVDQGYIQTGVPYVANNTILANSDVLFNYGGACPQPRQVIMKNNIFVGGLDYASGNPGELVDLFYVSGRVITNDGCLASNVTVTEDHNICVGSTFKLGTNYCNHATDKNVDPQFVGTLQQGIPTYPGVYSGTYYNNLLTLKSTSPAIGMADTGALYVAGVDYNGYARGASWDAGAVEFGSTSGGGLNLPEDSACTTANDCSSASCCFGTCYPTGACPAQPTKYFIDYTAGSDGNNGQSQTTPWKTCNPIEGSNFLKPGDTVNLKADSVFLGADAHCIISSNGTASNRITIKKYGTGANPIFDGSVDPAIDIPGWTGWTLTDAANNIYSSNVAVPFEMNGIRVDGVRTLARLFTSNQNASQLATFKDRFYKAPTTSGIVQVALADGSSPASHTIRFNRYRNAFNMMVGTSANLGSYINFYDIIVQGSNFFGFGSYGQWVNFIRCTGRYNAREGFMFAKNGATNGTGAAYNTCQNCLSQWNNTYGNNSIASAAGQGITIEAPYVLLIDTQSDHNWMAGIDWLDYNAQTDTKFGMCVRCKSFDNGLRAANKDNNGFDPPGLYCDGCNNLLVFDSEFYTTFDNTYNSISPVMVQNEHPATKPSTNIFFVNNRIYNSNFVEVVASKSLNCTGAACNVNSNIWFVGNTIKRGGSGFQNISAAHLLPVASGGKGVFYYGNIFYNPGGAAPMGSAPSIYHGDYNIFYNTTSPIQVATGISLAQWRINTGQDMNSLAIDPGFVTASGNFSLKQVAAGDATTSPGVDTGVDWNAVLGERFHFTNIGATRKDGGADTGVRDIGYHANAVFDTAQWFPATRNADGASCTNDTQCTNYHCCSGVCAAAACPAVSDQDQSTANINGSFGR